MCRPAMRVVSAGLIQAQSPVYGQTHIRGVLVFLPIILPPAHGAQSERVRRLQRPVPAARAAESSLNQSPHNYMDGKKGAHVYPKWRTISPPGRRISPSGTEFK
jgi:hypothetical protein